MTREQQISEVSRLLRVLQPWARLSEDEHGMALLSAECAPVKAMRIYRAIAKSLVPQ